MSNDDERIVEWFRQSKTDRCEVWISKAGWIQGDEHRSWTHGTFGVGPGQPHTIALGTAKTLVEAMEKLEKRYEPQWRAEIEKALTQTKRWVCEKCRVASALGGRAKCERCGGWMHEEEIDL